MKRYQIVRISEHPELIPEASQWFHEKWGIPQQAYLDSMTESAIHGAVIPAWYVALESGTVFAGVGVIENDFHDRKDLSPNVCAVYVEKPYRGQGIAAEMLKTVCRDMKTQGVKTLYLLTDHTSLYERYGWEFLCMVQGDGEANLSRMYVHKEE